MDRGSIVIRDGRFEVIGSSDPTPSTLEVIDAGGETVLPGLIDAHRHLLGYSRPTSRAELRTYIDTGLVEVLGGLLARGLTTVMSPGDAMPEILEIRQRLEDGDLVGPRLLTAGPLFTAPGDHPAGGPVIVHTGNKEDLLKAVEMGAGHPRRWPAPAMPRANTSDSWRCGRKPTRDCRSSSTPASGSGGSTRPGHSS